MTITVVPIEAQSPLEALWREFPQLTNSTIVSRNSWIRKDGSGISRTFRLLDGSYVEITSTEAGNKLTPADPDEVEYFEEAWNELGQRALSGEPHVPTGIMWRSDEFTKLVEELGGLPW